jgi:acetate---CoA ligase (ADP-forming)
VLLPPLTERRARDAVQSHAVADLLAGMRGRPAADVSALVGAVMALGALAEELGADLAALDVNPIVVGPDGAVAVDVFVERRTDVRAQR